MTFGLWWVLTHNKKANLPNYEYKLFKTSTFTILYIYSVKNLIWEKQKTHCEMNHWPPTLARQQRRDSTCRSHLTTGGPGKEQGTNKLPPTRILERSKRWETVVQRSYQLPRILLTGIHLGWVMHVPPGRIPIQNDWQETSQKLTQWP